MPLSPLPPYGWPLDPPGRMHPVRAYLNDPRDGEAASAFHFGIDISAPDGAPVRAVEPGRVHLGGPQNVAVVSAGSPRTFGYWHIVPAVAHGASVAAGAVLGHVARGWGHVHFAERSRAGEGPYLNPLRAGALTPFAPNGAPVIVALAWQRGGARLDPGAVSGPADLVVEAFDRPPLAVPPPWSGMPVTVARLRWRLLRGAVVARDWHTPVDLAHHMLPAEDFRRIYAPGTRQNHPAAPGRLRYFLAHTLTTRAFPDGDYRVEVEAANVRGTATTASFAARLVNDL